jgi:hypothetical protein
MMLAGAPRLVFSKGGIPVGWQFHYDPIEVLTLAKILSSPLHRQTPSNLFIQLTK